MLNETDLSRADLNLLHLFEVVLEERHVGRAASRLNLSPSAISHGLGRLRRLLKDPLFLKTPKGVVPTARANELAEPIADVLARARRVIASAEPFDPATSTRRFMLGVIDGPPSIPGLIAAIEDTAPGIDIGVRLPLPPSPGKTMEEAWEPILADLDARRLDIAILPLENLPARFERRVLYEESFVIAGRAGHPYFEEPTLDRYCEMRHVLASITGDPHGFVDQALAKVGRSRRVALTAPSFFHALSVVAETDLIAALPRTFAERHARRFGVEYTEVPLSLDAFYFRISAITPKVAIMDGGIAWLMDMLTKVARPATTASPRRRKKAA